MGGPCGMTRSASGRENRSSRIKAGWLCANLVTVTFRSTGACGRRSPSDGRHRREANYRAGHDGHRACGAPHSSSTPSLNPRGCRKTNPPERSGGFFRVYLDSRTSEADTIPLFVQATPATRSSVLAGSPASGHPRRLEVLR